MVFPYHREQLDSTASFPAGQELWRPVLCVKLVYGSASIDCWSLVDTGSDYCIFPADFATRLGLDLSLLPSSSVYGAGSDSGVRFAKVLMCHQDLGVWEVRAGFSPEWNGREAGALGNLGLFDRFRVSFDWQKREFEVKS